MPAWSLYPLSRRRPMVTAVMIGIDPHKTSHSATAIDGTETVLTRTRVKASAKQLERLLEWAAAWPERVWAIEHATGLGLLLAQQFLRAGRPMRRSRHRLRGS
jgi:hypothetical protein